jgi:hypothetical protein
MRTWIAVLFTVAVAGCMANWSDSGQVASIADTVSTADSAPEVDTDSIVVGCNTPTEDRLINNNDGTWHDKLLDLDCQFYKTASQGKRCLPFHNSQLAAGAKGNSDFPDSAQTSYYLSADCISHNVIYVHSDPKGRFPRFSFRTYLSFSDSDVLDMAWNLIDPPEDAVLGSDPITGKATSLKVNAGDGTGLHCNPNPPIAIQNFNQYNGLMIEDGMASIPACPLKTGFELFADMPQ